MIPVPTPREIRAAFEVLDFVGLVTAMKMRKDVERIARLPAPDGGKRRGRKSSTSKPWAREDVVLMWVLWKAFDQWLEHSLRNDKRNTSIH